MRSSSTRYSKTSTKTIFLYQQKQTVDWNSIFSNTSKLRLYWFECENVQNMPIVSAAINTLKSIWEEEERWKIKKTTRKKIGIIFLIHAFKFSSSAVVQPISWKSSLLSFAPTALSGLITSQLDLNCSEKSYFIKVKK